MPAREKPLEFESNDNLDPLGPSDGSPSFLALLSNKSPNCDQRQNEPS